MRYFWLIFTLFSTGCEKDLFEKKDAPNLMFIKQVKQYIRGGRFSTQEILAGIKGDKSGYALKSISALSPNDIATLSGKAPDLQLDFNKVGAFTATLVLEHKTRADVTLKKAAFEIEKFITFDTTLHDKAIHYKINQIIQTSDEGYALVGYRNTSDALSTLDFWVVKLDASGGIIWAKILGGDKKDIANAITQTDDGGYIIVGETESKGAGGEDVWVVKLDGDGNQIWDKTFGSVQGDTANQVLKTNDGGFVIVGLNGSKGAGNSDAWVIKLDADGDKQWDKTFGTLNYDIGKCVVTAHDGGYVFLGKTFGKGIGLNNMWLVKLDAAGDQIWHKTLEGADDVLSLVKTSDGGYVLLRATHNFGWESDIYLVKVNRSGTKIWDNKYNSPADGKYGEQLITTDDGGFAIIGFAVRKGAGNADLWMSKLDDKGTLEWEKVLGTSYDDEYGFSLAQTRDGGFIVAGGKMMFQDAWLLKLNKRGNL